MLIKTQKGHELVADHMLNKIKNDEWTVGMKIPSVVELAEIYGVGRSTIREAISGLKAMGWLDVRQGGGTFVKNVLPTDLKLNAGLLFQGAESLVELLEVRMAIEVQAASLAAIRRTDTQLEELTSLLSTMEKALEENDTNAGEQADVSFHMAIIRASGNSLLLQLMESLSERFNNTIQQSRELWFYHEQGTANRLLQEHEHILDAIRKQDAPLAAQVITSHLAKVIQVLHTHNQS